jgi:outer membrane protein
MNLKHPVAKATATIALVLFCASGHALDLMETYAKALQNDPRMLAADAALVAGREKAVQGDALLKPRIGVSAGLTRSIDRSSTSLPPQLAGLFPSQSASTLHQAGIHLVQPIYDAKASADRAQLRERSELAEIQHRDARQQLMERASEAYFNVLLAQEMLRVVGAEKIAVGMQRDRAQARFDVGRGRITELQEAQARYDAVLTREVSAQSNLALQQAQYEALTGVPAHGLAELPGGFVPQAQAAGELQSWIQRGLEQHPRVLAKRHELAIAEAEIGRHSLSARPSLELVASATNRGQHGNGSATLSPDSSRGATIGLQFSLPLFAGGAIQSRERESIAKRRQAEHELGSAQRDTRLQVQDRFLAVQTGVARIAAQTQSLQSAQTALDATTQGRDVGTRTELAVLDAQQRVHATRMDLAQARTDYLLARVQLAAAAGQLREEDLAEVNAMLGR